MEIRSFTLTPQSIDRIISLSGSQSEHFSILENIFNVSIGGQNFDIKICGENPQDCLICEEIIKELYHATLKNNKIYDLTIADVYNTIHIVKDRAYQKQLRQRELARIEDIKSQQLAIQAEQQAKREHREILMQEPIKNSTALNDWIEKSSIDLISELTPEQQLKKIANQQTSNLETDLTHQLKYNSEFNNPKTPPELDSIVQSRQELLNILDNIFNSSNNDLVDSNSNANQDQLTYAETHAEALKDNLLNVLNKLNEYPELAESLPNIEALMNQMEIEQSDNYNDSNNNQFKQDSVDDIEQINTVTLDSKASQDSSSNYDLNQPIDLDQHTRDNLFADYETLFSPVTTDKTSKTINNSIEAQNILSDTFDLWEHEQNVNLHNHNNNHHLDSSTINNKDQSNDDNEIAYNPIVNDTINNDQVYNPTLDSRDLTHLVLDLPLDVDLDEETQEKLELIMNKVFIDAIAKGQSIEEATATTKVYAQAAQEQLAKEFANPELANQPDSLLNELKIMDLELSRQTLADTFLMPENSKNLQLELLSDQELANLDPLTLSQALQAQFEANGPQNNLTASNSSYTPESSHLEQDYSDNTSSNNTVDHNLEQENSTYGFNKFLEAHEDAQQVIGEQFSEEKLLELIAKLTQSGALDQALQNFTQKYPDLQDTKESKELNNPQSLTNSSLLTNSSALNSSTSNDPINFTTDTTPSQNSDINTATITNKTLNHSNLHNQHPITDNPKEFNTSNSSYFDHLAELEAQYQQEAIKHDGKFTELVNGTIKAQSVNQDLYIKSIIDKDITFGIGPAGTGKTYLAVAVAVDYLFNNRVKKIILTRPAVEAGEKLGFLPGDISQKLDPYLKPLFDALEDFIGTVRLQKFIESGIVEIAPLAFMRGRTLSDSFIILDEAQNTTKEQMKMFLTRLGFGSKMVVTGDTSQIDLPHKTQSGLIHAQLVLSKIPTIKVHNFFNRDIRRHPTVNQVVNAYDLWDCLNPPPEPPKRPVSINQMLQALKQQS